MLYFDFPYGGEQLAATYNYTFEKQSDIFYCQESDRQYLPGLIKEWRMFVSNVKTHPIVIRKFFHFISLILIEI